MAEEWENPVAKVAWISEEGEGLRARSGRRKVVDSEEMIEGSTGDDDDAVVGQQARSVSLDQAQGIKVVEGTNRIRLEKTELPFVVVSSQNWEVEFITENNETFPVMANSHNRQNMKVERQETSSSDEEMGTRAEGRIDKLKQVAVIDEGDVVVNVNLERILDEQETHDLYCPNCHSCITKRVILRKRKRTTREDTSDPKCAKTGPAQLDCILSASVVENKDETQTSEPEVFRCLSCFSYFIPTDNGFRLFKNFGKREENDSTQGPEVPERSQNWLFFVYDLMMGKKKESELGLASNIDKEENKVSSLILPGQTEKHLPDELKISPEFRGETPAGGENIGSEVEKLKHDPKMCIQTPPKNETLVFGQEENGKAENVYLPEVGNEDGIMPATEGMGKHIKGTFSAGPSRGESSLLAPEVALPVQSEARILIGEPTTGEARQTPQWDILKAIVYGGLLESIVALGVISAAAGCDIRTVSVVALGLANLAGGLPALIHNLFELRNGPPSRYEELLGKKKGRFWVHLAVASLCFILLGASPPVIYGLSFRKSDDRELKMAVVAGASLVCVALLAVAKAHAQEGGKKPYFQTLLRYVGLAVAGSGLSYVVGTAAKKLLEKLALFDGWAAILASPFSSGLELAASTAPPWRAY